MSGIFARTPSQDHLLAYMTLWYAESYKKFPLPKRQRRRKSKAAALEKPIQAAALLYKLSGIAAAL